MGHNLCRYNKEKIAELKAAHDDAMTEQHGEFETKVEGLNEAHAGELTEQKAELAAASAEALATAAAAHQAELAAAEVGLASFTLLCSQDTS
jgi:hypothetical protein